MRSVSFASVALSLALSSAVLGGGCRTFKGGGAASDSPRAPGDLGDLRRMGGAIPLVETELENGVRVLIEENHVAPVVAIEVWVAAGAADDPPALAGAAHLYEHLLYRGTKRRGPGAAARELDEVKGTLGAWTGLDETVYYAMVASPFLELGLDVLADAIASPGFEEAEVERVRKQALDEIAGERVDPARRATEALFGAAFAGHPYGRSVLGTAASVAALDRAALRSRFAQTYAAPALMVVVVGDVDGRAQSAVARAFGGIPRTRPAPADAERGARAPSTAAAPTAPVSTPAVSTSRVAVATVAARPPALVLGFRTPALRAQDAAGLDLLAAILARDETGRLPRELVRNGQLADGVRPFTFHSRQGGLVALAITPAPHRIAEAAEAAADLALRLAYEPPTAEEVARARTAVESDLAHREEGVLGRARRLGFGAAIARDREFADHYREELDRLGPAELQAAATKFLNADRLTVAVALPEGPSVAREESAAALQPRLEAMVAGAAALAARHASARAPAVAGGDVVRFEAPSGARILVLRDKTAPLVSVEAAWGGGADEQDAVGDGAAPLLAALIDRGTRTRTAAELATQMRAMGGALEGFAASDVFGLRADFLPRHLEHALSVIADCLLHPAFPEDELDVERRALLGRMRAAAQGPEAGPRAALRLFHETLSPRGPGRSDGGEAVSALTRVRLLDRYRRGYPLSRLVVAVVGDVDPAGVVATLGLLLPGGTKGAPPREPSAPPRAPSAPPSAAAPPPVAARAEPITVFRTTSTGQADVVVGYPTFAPGDPDRVPMELLAEILGGEGGRLEGALRDGKTFAYRASARAAGGAEPGYLAVAVTCAPPRLDAAVAAVRAAFARVATGGVTPDEVTRAARRLIGARAAALRSRTAIADALVRDEARGLPMLSFRRYPAVVARIGADDVARAARRILDPNREVIAVVTGTGK